MEYLRRKSLLEESLKRRRGIDVSLCYQCGKCTNGCPLSLHMEVPPHKVIRMIQMGMEKVLDVNSPWFCASCLTCSVRCPNGIEVAKVMDFLREIAMEKGAGEKEGVLFHKLFLENVKKRGRLSEISFMGRFVMGAGRLAKDAKWAFKSFLKGKLNLFPSKVKDTSHVRKLFLRCKV